ncbi:hypothetical protein EDD17DRAFT_1516027 [Pisolithus thermaeus]|nr:hypothetical protein EV401DRAFT_1894539 [Pisolithus croceorrhizus]KAI6141573.1 hypothetical protein EDD17DRAFT_1516027 [Pisolithus thermaeus]
MVQWGTLTSHPLDPNLSPTQWTLLVWVEERTVHHYQAKGLVGGSYTFGDSVHYNSESNPLVHSCVNYTPSNTTRNAELGSARVEDAYTGLPQNAVQEARTLANGHQYANCLTMQCLYPGREEMLCLQELSCGTVSSHFASHGIENKSRTEIIRCEWKGCVANVTRHAFHVVPTMFELVECSASVVESVPTASTEKNKVATYWPGYSRSKLYTIGRIVVFWGGHSYCEREVCLLISSP